MAGKLLLARGWRVPGLLRAGYAAVKGTGAVTTGPGLVAIAADACLRVVSSGSRRGWHPEVLVAAGLGLIGPDLDHRREAG
jgi:hypothetical protein